MSIHIPKPQIQPQIEAGTYLARCYSMIHIGTVSFVWQGKESSSNKVRITFELPTEKKVFKEENGLQPLVISAEYGLSLHPKSKLRPILEGWRGKTFTDEEAENFEVSKLVGVPAFLNIIHNEKGYATISSISRVPKGMECPSQINPSQVLDYENFDEELFAKLPEFLQKKIESSVEYQKMRGTWKGISEEESLEAKSTPNYAEGEVAEEDIPFA